MSTIKELLGTDNKKEQEAAVENLINEVNQPVIDIVIRYDNKTDQVSLTLIGGDVAFDTVHRMLDLASQAVRHQELETAINRVTEAGQEEKEVEE